MAARSMRQAKLETAASPGWALAPEPRRLERLARDTPLLLFSLETVRRRFQDLAQGLDGAAIYYAVKANPERPILRLLQGLGAGFEISSLGELRLLLSLGQPPEKLISSHPVKAPAFIKAGWEAGLRRFAFDSAAEVDKLAALAPGCQVYVRLDVPDEASQWPLSPRFGVEAEEALRLLHYAGERGLKPCGLAFHVGSQCTQPSAWPLALEKASQVWREALRGGLEMAWLNIGGGLPVPYCQPLPPPHDFLASIREAVARLFPQGQELVIEPGRFLVGEAGILASTVIAKAWRGGQRWLYVDAGVFHGLIEALGGTIYPILASREGEPVPWVLAGPTCDNFDIIAQRVELPEMEIGDRVFILSAGAYTTTYASTFNGFPIPKVRFIKGRGWL